MVVLLLRRAARRGHWSLWDAASATFSTSERVRRISPEHAELQLEEDDRIDRGPAALGVELARQVADEAEVELCLQVPVEVVLGNQVLQGNDDREVEAAGLGRAEHQCAPSRDARYREGHATRP